VRRLSPREDLSAALDDRVRVLASVLPGIDRVIAPTAFGAERARDSGLPMPEVQVTPLGVTTHARPRAPGPRRRVAFVGTLAPHKGVHVLIDAFRGLPDADLRLDLHGSLTVAPAYVHDLRRRAEGDARIHFHGPFSEPEQPRIFASFDVLVLPSLWWETTGLVLLEALAEGRVVIASRTGGIPEVVGANGRLVSPGDVAALREALEDVTSGRSLAGAGPAPAIPTADEGAAALVALYASLRPVR
jgi:glycosyltransferase involved in cell wall biosynthesis